MFVDELPNYVLNPTLDNYLKLEWLGKIPKLHALDIEFEPPIELAFEDYVSACNVIEKSELQTLHVQELSYAHAYPSDFSPLFSCIGRNTSITRLELCHCYIDDGAACCIARMLERNAMLRELFVQSNGIGDVGAVALAKALETNSTLIELDLFDNKIRQTGMMALAKALLTNDTLMFLNVASTRMLTQASQKAFEVSLTFNARLRSLKIYTLHYHWHGDEIYNIIFYHTVKRNIRKRLEENCSPTKVYAKRRRLRKWASIKRLFE
jgi:Leucine Rich repeat